MALHLGRMIAIALLILFCTVYPFLPGEYDRFGVGLLTIAQTLGAVGLLFVPVGVGWLVHELRHRAKRRQGLPHAEWGYRFGVASLVVASFVAVALSFAAAASLGASAGVLAIGMSAFGLWRLIPRLKRSRYTAREPFHPAPLYLTFIPPTVLLGQLLLARPATEFSRNRAIDNSAELIGELERYRAARGRYPASMLALWPDYSPSVVGIRQYHYAPQGDAYNLYFEQPSFRWGTQEIVVYNRLDEHVILSHAAWILSWTPEQMAARRGGWYAVHDAPRPHWKYFWFD